MNTLADLRGLVERKREQADMADHPKATPYMQGAASAMRVFANELEAALPALLDRLERAEAVVEAQREICAMEALFPCPVDQAPEPLAFLRKLKSATERRDQALAAYDQATKGAAHE